MPNYQDLLNQYDPNSVNRMLGGSPFGIMGRTGGATQGSPAGINQFMTSPLSLSMLQNYLQGNEKRTAGTAGQYAGAYASSKGYDPYAYSQHAMANVYDQYANQYAQLPQIAFQSQLQSNQANFGNIMALLQAQLAQQQYKNSTGFNFVRDLLPGLIAGGGKIGAAALTGGAAAPALLSQSSPDMWGGVSGGSGYNYP